ncbi:MAG: hypothetical protein RL120_12825 [Gammaproteobacteria bacterium]
MNEVIKQRIDRVVARIEKRPRSEKLLVLGIVLAGLFMSWLTFASDPLKAGNSQARAQIANTQRQIQAQQTTYENMLVQSQEDPNRFANERLTVVIREQQELDGEIQNLAGDLVTPNDMTRILTEVLERQQGLELVAFQNSPALPLRSGVSNAAQILEQTGALNLDQVVEQDVAGQVYEHGLTIQFEGDFFSTLRYLLFLEQVTGSFFWDGIYFEQLEWPRANVRLEIHTLSTDQGFIGV